MKAKFGKRECVGENKRSWGCVIKGGNERGKRGARAKLERRNSKVVIITKKGGQKNVRKGCDGDDFISFIIFSHYKSAAGQGSFLTLSTSISDVNAFYLAVVNAVISHPPGYLFGLTSHNSSVAALLPWLFCLNSPEQHELYEY